MAETLTVDRLVVRTATRVAVDELSLSLTPGKIVALLGPNGAGKSELVLAMAGMLPAESGAISLGATELTGLRPEAIRALGVAAVPEGHRVLTTRSVDDNLTAAGSMHTRKALGQARQEAYDIFPELQPLRDKPAGTMSGGQQQMLAFAQAIMCQPKFLLADEMSLGLAPIVVNRLMGVLANLKERGVGILLIEQFTHLALGVADHVHVVKQGRCVFDGQPDALASNPGILHDAYLSS